MKSMIVAIALVLSSQAQAAISTIEESTFTSKLRLSTFFDVTGPSVTDPSRFQINAKGETTRNPL